MAAMTELDATTYAAAIRRGSLKSEDVVRECLRRIDALEPRIRAFRDLAPPEQVLEYARELDSRETRSGSLYGVPVAIKEVIDVAGLHCSWGTSIHQARVPNRDAAAVAKLRDAGAVILGTTISTEYAIAAAGPTTNPHDESRTPGGSSSGSAAAVAAGMVPLALGTQTIGSIIRPATYCGIYGFKPAYGDIDAGGVMPLSPRLDHVGIFARTLADVALAYRTLLDPEITDRPTIDELDPDDVKIPSNIYLVDGDMSQPIDASSRTALRRVRNILESSGATVIRATFFDDFAEAADCANTVLCRGLAANHGHDRDRAGEQMSRRLRSLIDHGRTVSDECYDIALSCALQYREALLGILGGDSVIVAPATDGVAPPLQAGTGSSDLQALYSLTGLPTLAVPCGMVDGLPVGVQAVAAPGREALILKIARLLSPVGERQDS